MRVSASEKLELIRLVEGSSLSIRRTLTEIGHSRSTFYAWYKRYLEGGPGALEDRKPRCRSVWNRIPDRVRAQVIETALVHTELSPRELAWRLTDREGEFVSGIERLPHPQGRRPDREPGLHPAAGGGSVPTPDPGAQRALADGLHVSAGGGLGLVLPLDCPG